jgi:DNA-binding response OmpR family regulator
MEINILVVDDDAVFRTLICDILQKQGYLTHESSDGQQALDYFFSHGNEIDLVILDVMMPHLDGWEVLKAIRAHSEVPILMLTALGQENHVVFGLKNGSDDYIAKPFSYQVFVARVHALLRKVRKERESNLNEGCLIIDQQKHKVYVNEQEIVLDNKEFAFLVYLITNKGQVLSREQILSAVWGYDFEGDVRTIDTHIKTLRAKLLTCGDYIQTVRGIGYRFEAIQ